MYISCPTFDLEHRLAPPPPPQSSAGTAPASLSHTYSMAPNRASTLVAAILLPLLVAFLPRLIKQLRPASRLSYISPFNERILILGASSGTGKSLALAYAVRNPAHLVLVARRQDELDGVRNECIALGAHQEVSTFVADCSSIADIHSLAMHLSAIGGIDTVHVVFGTSALKPLLGVAGIDPTQAPTSSSERSPAGPTANTASLESLQAVGTAMVRMSETNQAATAVALAALVPILQTTSQRPAVVVLSSVAALVPAPTRALYGAAKAAQLVLVEGVALEAERQAQEPGRSLVRFATVLPGTIATSFRASAVDLAPGETPALATKDASWDAGSTGTSPTSRSTKSDILTPDQVANAMVWAVDQESRGRIAMPSKYAWALRIQPFAPDFLGRKAHAKYGY